MKLTKSKLKQIIKEEISLMRGLEVEENFIKKHDINIKEEALDEVIDPMNAQVLSNLLHDSAMVMALAAALRIPWKDLYNKIKDAAGKIKGSPMQEEELREDADVMKINQAIARQNWSGMTDDMQQAMTKKYVNKLVRIGYDPEAAAAHINLIRQGGI